MKTATKVKDLDRANGVVALYKLSERLKFYNYVVVSSATVYGEDETYIFGADENGEVIDWIELSGSQRGVYNHETALNNAGYEVKL
jgi:hypothetical protein